MNYNVIINPETNKPVILTSILGKRILKKYVDTLTKLKNIPIDRLNLERNDPKSKLLKLVFNLMKTKSDNYLKNCNKKCVAKDIIYQDKKYKLVNNIDLNIDFLNRVSENLNFINSYNYVYKNILAKSTKIIFSGDYHSSIYALLQFILELKNKQYLDDNFRLKTNYNIVFTGDIVDRGPYGFECLYIIFLLVIINDKNRIILTKGNHESKSVYTRYGFADELRHSELSFDIINKLEIILSRLMRILQNIQVINYGINFVTGIDNSTIYSDKIKLF